MSVIEIKGGAGPQETAAILVAVARVLEEESQQRATPEGRPEQSAWVLAWRPREAPAPLPSTTFESMPWSELETPEADNGEAAPPQR